MGEGALVGAVDSVGSRTLANVLSEIKYDGAVAGCGLAQGSDLPATVLPFILRDVTLAGVDDLIRAESSKIVSFLFRSARGGDNAIAELV